MRNVAFSFASALRSSKLHSCGSCSAERDHVIRRVLQTRSRAVTTSARSSQAAAAANPSGYFSQNSELLSRKKYEDIEDSWRRAQLTSDGKLPCESAQEHLKRIAIERDARLANAALSFDDLLAGSALPSGLGHRDIIMRTTTLDTQGEVLKRSELVAKSQLCTNHGLQVRLLFATALSVGRLYIAARPSQGGFTSAKWYPNHVGSSQNARGDKADDQHAASSEKRPSCSISCMSGYLSKRIPSSSLMPSAQPIRSCYNNSCEIYRSV